MARMDAPFLTVGVYPDPDDDRTLENLGELLVERGARPDGTGFFVDRGRRLHVQRVPASDGRDPRPVEIMMSAGPLGDPGYRRHEILAAARYVATLFAAVTDRTRPLYGAVGVEAIFPRPADLRRETATQGFAADPIFVRTDLLARAGLGAALTDEYTEVTEGPPGTIYASLRFPHREKWEGGRILGRVVARHLVERERAKS